MINKEIVNNNISNIENIKNKTILQVLRDYDEYIKENAKEGPQGPKGDAGPAGPTGARGPQGSKGDKGDVGATGATGAMGATGPTGATGPRGLQGEQGPQGPRGSQGAKGDKGETGAQGPTGATGATGPQGETGATGPIGPQGPQGPKGDKGDKGDSGNDFTIVGYVSSTASLPTNLTSSDVGTAYLVGTSTPRQVYLWGYNEGGLLVWSNQGTLQGPRGDVGPQGPQGPTGATGATGPTGATGATGATGPQGAAGLNGQGFNYMASWVSNNEYYEYDVVTYQGSSYVCILAINGSLVAPDSDTTHWSLFVEKGQKGDTGATGPQGPQGATGATGPQGPKGDTGATGATGPQGPKGDTGETGPQGPEGPAGASVVVLADNISASGVTKNYSATNNQIPDSSLTNKIKIELPTSITFTAGKFYTITIAIVSFFQITTVQVSGVFAYGSAAVIPFLGVALNNTSVSSGIASVTAGSTQLILACSVDPIGNTSASNIKITIREY